MDCTAITTTNQSAPARLSELAERANYHHRQCTAAANTALDHAHAAGDHLLQIKTECRHGDFASLLKANFRGSPQTARLYMLVAKRWPAIAAERQRVGILSLRRAAMLIAEKNNRPASSASVDHLPELSSDRQFFGFDPDDMSYLVEVYPSKRHPGYFHLGISRGFDTGPGECTYDRRPVRYTKQILASALKSVHGVTPTRWRSEPAIDREPWFIDAQLAERQEGGGE